MPTTAEKRAIFRKLHESGFFILPNAWDVGSAVRLEKLGFKAIASTSAAAAWGLGKEDGEISLDEALAHLRMLVGATSLPVNADFENGFAHDPEATARNAVLAAETGVAGLSIEDWSGNAYYDKALAVERIAACRAALDPAVMLIGRHEKFRDPNLSTADSIARAVAYAEAGADCLFVPGLADHGAIAELVAAVAPRPVNVVVHEYDERIVQLAKLGARRCSVGGSLAAAAWGAFDAAARTLRDYGP
jgi:2-methylisocitrate lyase-like PEP mutase family enzyme